MEDVPKRTTLQRVQRAARFTRTIPMTWVDSQRYGEADLSSSLGFFEARYRINTPEAVFIVRTMALGISEAMLKSAGIERMTSCFLIAVRSLLGDAFPEVTSDEGAAEIQRLNERFQNGSEQCGIEIEAVYRHNRCERTGREFRFEDWIDEPAAAEPDVLKDVEWSNYRTPQEWRGLRKAKGLAASEGTWLALRKKHPDDIHGEPGNDSKSCQITRSLAESWELSLPEFTP